MPYQDSPEGQDHSSASSGAPNPPKARTYAETVNHHYLLFQDTDLVNWGWENGVVLENVEKFSPCIVGNSQVFQHSDAKLRICSLSPVTLPLPRVRSMICSTENQCYACRREKGTRSSAWTGCSWRLFIRWESWLSFSLPFIIFSQFWACDQWKMKGSRNS